MFAVTSILVETDRAVSPDLLQRAQSGDADAFCEYCRPHEARLFRQAMALCGDHSLAEDLAQDTLIEAWKCVRRYNGRCRFFTWLCAILLNRYRNLRREKRPLPLSRLNAAEQEHARDALECVTDGALQPDDAAQQIERDTLLRRSILQLSPKHREVIHMRFFVDDSLEGIAAALNCSVGTVKSRLFYALEKLRAIQVSQDEREI